MGTVTSFWSCIIILEKGEVAREIRDSLKSRGRVLLCVSPLPNPSIPTSKIDRFISSIFPMIQQRGKMNWSCMEEGMGSYNFSWFWCFFFNGYFDSIIWARFRKDFGKMFTRSEMEFNKAWMGRQKRRKMNYSFSGFGKNPFLFSYVPRLGGSMLTFLWQVNSARSWKFNWTKRGREKANSPRMKIPFLGWWSPHIPPFRGIFRKEGRKASFNPCCSESNASEQGFRTAQELSLSPPQKSVEQNEGRKKSALILGVNAEGEATPNSSPVFSQAKWLPQRWIQPVASEPSSSWLRKGIESLA